MCRDSETVSIQWSPCDPFSPAASHHQINQGLLYWPMLHWVICNAITEKCQILVSYHPIKFDIDIDNHHIIIIPSLIFSLHFPFLFLVFAVISMNRMLALLLAALPLGLNKCIANNIPGSWWTIINKNWIWTYLKQARVQPPSHPPLEHFSWPPSDPPLVCSEQFPPPPRRARRPPGKIINIPKVHKSTHFT